MGGAQGSPAQAGEALNAPPETTPHAAKSETVGEAAAEGDKDPAGGALAELGASEGDDEPQAAAPEDDGSPQNAEDPLADLFRLDENGRLPSEGDLLVRLVTTIQKLPGRKLPLADIRARLPAELRRYAEDVDKIRQFLVNFPVVELVGEPGEEVLQLTVGRTSPSGGAPLPPGAMPAGVSAAEAPGAALAVPRAPPAQGAADEETITSSTVQLRGLPFKATVEDVKAFLGEHAAHLSAVEPAVRLLQNRDGRPSGFARVQFAAADAARAAREALHREKMGDRYIEVLACSERRGKSRHLRGLLGGEVAAAAADGVAGSASEATERERVLQECREYMRSPGQQCLLLSMLGIALSAPARAYLRRAELGLKHFLARYPGEFRVEGPKGCERVLWMPAGYPIEQVPVESQPGEAGGPLLLLEGGAACPPTLLLGDEALPPMPSTPKGGPSQEPRRMPQSAQLTRTPSNWGTPLNEGARDSHKQSTPKAQREAAALAEAAANFPQMGWGPYGWPTGPWPGAAWPAPWGGWDPTQGVAGGGKNEQGRRAPAGTKGKDAPASSSANRSHAHLHPQSHPFANQQAKTKGGGTSGQGCGVEDVRVGTDVAALRLRGLPFTVSVQDVLAFFATHEVVERIADGPQATQLLMKANGKPSGQAVVQMRSRQCAEIACKALQGQYLGGRYVEVFVYGDEHGHGGHGGDMLGMQAFPGAGPPFGGLPPWSLAAPWAGLGAGLAPPPLPGAVAGADGEASMNAHMPPDIWSFICRDPNFAAGMPGPLVGPGAVPWADSPSASTATPATTASTPGPDSAVRETLEV